MGIILMKQTGMTKLLINFRKDKLLPSKGNLFGNFPTLPNKFATLLPIGLILSGCGELFEPTISQICESNNTLCLDLNLDARCRYERADIIRLRYNHQDDPSDAYKYPLLLAFEDYLVCVEEVQHIEHIKRKGKEATRLKGVITAQKEIKRLSRETKNSHDPHLSYYHWSRFGDKEALHRFERFAKSSRVKDPQLLISLASIQVKTDIPSTINTLYRALSLYEDSSAIDASIFPSLASLAMKQENYRMAYVWYGVSAHYNENISSSQQQQLMARSNLPVNILDAIIDDVITALDAGTFDADALKLERL